MTHEFKTIIEHYQIAESKGFKAVLATVVDLDGSSYRKPGVRMLILENGKMIGAVSGGCVEKEILLQTKSVFKTGISKMMTYDGRYRLGCEGVLYILLENLKPNNSFITTFCKGIKTRISFEINSYYQKKEGVSSGIGTQVIIENKIYSLSQMAFKESESLIFKQHMPPCFKLVIIGAEHDAVELCKLAVFSGWEVTIIAGVKESKSINNFPGATQFYAINAEQLDKTTIDNQTAVVLMTHNFANDLRHLVALKNTMPNYIGILGPVKRRDDLLSQFIEFCPDVEESFIDVIHGPAGINIGAITPQEIALSVVSEILSVIRKQEPISLSKKSGKIHSI